MTSWPPTTCRPLTTWAGCWPGLVAAPRISRYANMREILDELRAWNEAGEQIALATVVETWGSSPRPLGSRMAVTRSGKMAGSVSNGCIEGAVFEEAQKVLKSGEPKIAAFGVADDVAFEVGLACGGHIEVFVQPLDAVQKKLIGMLEKDEPATLRTNLVTGESQLVAGTSPRSAAARRTRTASTPSARKASPKSRSRVCTGRSVWTWAAAGRRRLHLASLPSSQQCALPALA